MPATFKSGTQQQQSSPAFTTKDFQLFFDDPESDSQESSPSFSSSSSSASTLQTIPSPPTFYLPTSSLPIEAQSSSFSGSLFPLDTSFMSEKIQIQQQSNSKKRSSSEMEQLQESESWNVNQSLSPSGWTSLRAPTIVFSAGQNSNQEATSIEQWLLQQQSNQNSQSHNQSHQHHHAQPHAQSQLQLAGYPNSNRGNEAMNGNTSNYSHTHHLDRVYDGIGNNSAVRSGAINNVGNFVLMSRRNGAQSTSYARTPETSCASHLQIQHPNSFYTSSNNSNQAASMASTSNGTSSLVPRSEMSNQPNNDTSNQSSSSSSNDSPFVDPRKLFFTPRNQLDSALSSFRDQQPPPQVQYQYPAQSQGGQSYIPNTYQFQYQSSNTYSSLNQSQYSNSRYTNQSSSSQSYHPSPSTSPTSSVLPPNRSIESGMVASYSQPPYEEPPTRPFSWEPQKSQQVKKEDPELKSPSPRLEPNSRASTSRLQPSSSKATIVLRGPKGTQHADLPYDLSPQDLNPKPPASDFATKDVNKRPIDQSDKIRHTMDRYTPKYVRGSGAAREGFCSLCPGDGKWLRLKSSAYNFHLLYAHGIDSISGLRFPAPTELRYVYTSTNSEPQTQNDTDDPDSDPHSRNTEGKCPNCKEWIHLTSGKRKPSFALFYKHMHAHGEVRKEFPPFSPEIESKDPDYSDEERGAKGKRRRTR